MRRRGAGSLPVRGWHGLPAARGQDDGRDPGGGVLRYRKFRDDDITAVQFATAEE